jgi:hypothetical protein
MMVMEKIQSTYHDQNKKQKKNCDNKIQHRLVVTHNVLIDAVIDSPLGTMGTLLAPRPSACIR